MDGKTPGVTDASFARAVLEALHAQDEYPHPEEPDIPDPPIEPEDPAHVAMKWHIVRRAMNTWSP